MEFLRRDHEAIIREKVRSSDESQKSGQQISERRVTSSTNRKIPTAMVWPVARIPHKRMAKRVMLSTPTENNPRDHQ